MSEQLQHCWHGDSHVIVKFKLEENHEQTR